MFLILILGRTGLGGRSSSLSFYCSFRACGSQAPTGRAGQSFPICLVPELWQTEAYLGVAAFAMAIRRMQGNYGYDGQRGLTVMRYTLRLLTLQQFQATTLICAMELERQEAVANGDKRL